MPPASCVDRAEEHAPDETQERGQDGPFFFQGGASRTEEEGERRRKERGEKRHHVMGRPRRGRG